jgi:hypothetical protein
VREKPAVLLYISDSPAQQDSWLRTNITLAHSDFSAQGLDQSIEAAKKRRLT